MAETTKQYLVKPGSTHSAWVGEVKENDDGTTKKLGRHITLKAGEVVTLTDKEAKHKALKGKIMPHVPTPKSGGEAGPNTVLLLDEEGNVIETGDDGAPATTTTAKKSGGGGSAKKPAPAADGDTDWAEIVNTSSAADVKGLIDAADSADDVQAILDAENSRETPRTTVVSHAEAKLEKLNS